MSIKKLIRRLSDRLQNEISLRNDLETSSERYNRMVQPQRRCQVESVLAAVQGSLQTRGRDVQAMSSRCELNSWVRT